MSGEARKLLKAALRLSVKERADFAGTLIQSLDEGGDSGTDAAWAAEITRRVKEIDDGKVKLIPWSTVQRRLRRRLASRPDGR